MKFCNQYSMITITLFLFAMTIKSTNDIDAHVPKYHRIYWNKNQKKWHTYVYIGIDKTGKQIKIWSGYWKTKLDAAKMVNKICDTNNIARKYEDVDAQPIEKKSLYIKSNYHDVFWNKNSKTWYVSLHFGKADTGKQIKISGGTWKNELDAARMVNKMCDQHGIKRKNEDVNAEPIEQKIETYNIKSKYKYVYWNQKHEKWHAFLYFGRDETGQQIQITGGHWNTELDAARMVNKMCDQHGMERKNEDVNAEPIKQKKETSIIKKLDNLLNGFDNEEINVQLTEKKTESNQSTTKKRKRKIDKTDVKIIDENSPERPIHIEAPYFKSKFLLNSKENSLTQYL